MNSLYKRIVTMGMLSFTAVLAWVYCILAYKDKPVYVVVMSLVLVASTYALLNAFIGLKMTKEAKLQNYIYETINATLTKITGEDNAEELERLSKASYVQLRKSNTLLNQMAEDNSNNYQQSIQVYNELNASMMKMFSDSVNKATKVIIKYNQTDNEKLLSAVNEFSSALDRISAELSSVKSEIANIQINISDVANTSTPVSSPQTDATPDLSSFFEEFGDEVEESTEVEEIAPTPMEETTITDIVTDTAIAEPADDNPNKQLSADEIAALFEASKEDRRAKSDDDFQIHDHPEAMDQSLIDALLGHNNSTPEMESETKSEPEPIIETEKIADVIPFPSSEQESETEINTEANSPTADIAPDFDPNKQLSSDEIAALFASMNGGAPSASTEEIAVTEPEPEPEPEPIASLDLDNDPNKKLSPEEIAALFASVQ